MLLNVDEKLHIHIYQERAEFWEQLKVSDVVTLSEALKVQYVYLYQKHQSDTTNDIDSELGTQELHSEPISSNQLMDEGHSQGMECYPDNLSSDYDAFTIAFNVLEQVARKNGFAIHNVPLYDGDCLFSSIAYQLHAVLTTVNCGKW